MDVLNADFAGHNGPSFDDVVMENLERGLLLAQRDCAARALQDHRLSQRHRVVLAQLILMTNQTTGTAFPGRKFLAETTGYSEAGVAKTISELVDMAYVISTRRAPEPGRRPLAHYAIIKPTIGELQQAIAAHIEALRRPNVTPVGNVTYGGNVTPWRNVTSPDVTPIGNVTSEAPSLGNVTPVDPTVTSIDSLLTDRPIPTPAVSKPKQSSHAKRLAKGTRIAADWVLPQTWGQWALNEFAVSADAIRAEGKRFHRFWKAQPGARGLKLDWFATWQNWCDSDKRSWPRRASAQPDGPDLLSAAPTETEHDRQLALVREQREQRRRQDASG